MSPYKDQIDLAHEGRNGRVGGAVVLNNKPIGEPELPVFGILRFAKGLERSAKDAVLTIQDCSPIAVVAADGSLECGQASRVVLKGVGKVDF